jgi:hypothetical protein
MNPYKELKADKFWKKFSKDITQLYEKEWKFDVNSHSRFANFGSCFALNIEKKLTEINIINSEEYPKNWPETYSQFNYANYSARYGNIYNPRQFRQLFERAFDIKVPTDKVWIDNAKLIDPFRPGLGWRILDMKEFNLLHSNHMRAIRDIPKSSDVVILTLGLNETWQDIRDGFCYPSCPGTIAGTFDTNKHKLKILTLNDLIEDLNYAIDLLSKLNDKLKFVLTLSPVPMVATASSLNIAEANVNSKANLKLAIQEIVNNNKNVDYFPSYDLLQIIGSTQSIFDTNGRSIKESAVDLIMTIFKHKVGINYDNLNPTIEYQNDALLTSDKLIEKECEEEFNNRFG